MAHVAQISARMAHDWLPMRQAEAACGPTGSPGTVGVETDGTAWYTNCLRGRLSEPDRGRAQTMKRRNLVMLCGAFGIVAVACGSDDSNLSNAPEGAGDQRILVSENASVSDCGGFHATERDLGGYCDAERLIWSYDEAQRVLSLANTRVLLNCCGDRTFDVYLDQVTGKYEAIVEDEPDCSSGYCARCSCMCIFDISTEVSGVDSRSIDLVVRRNVPDWTGLQELWDGSLDLGLGAGEVVLSDVPSDECMFSVH